MLSLNSFPWSCIRKPLKKQAFPFFQLLKKGDFLSGMEPGFRARSILKDIAAIEQKFGIDGGA